MWPWERNFGNQSVRARSSSVLAGSGSPVCVVEADGEQAGALGVAERAHQVAQAVAPGRARR